MSNENSERDKHFQGYAKLLMPELDSLFILLYQAYATGNTAKRDEYSQRIETLLAQRGYDLLYHARVETCYGMDLFNIKGWLEEVPDLTQWPKSSS